MIQIAKKNEPKGFYVLMDMVNLGLQNNSLNGIWACASLLHLSRRHIKEVMDNFYKILIPNGILFLSLKKGNVRRPF